MFYPNFVDNYKKTHKPVQESISWYRCWGCCSSKLDERLSGNKWEYYDACERAFQVKLRDNGHMCVLEIETCPGRTGWCGLNTCVLVSGVDKKTIR